MSIIQQLEDLKEWSKDSTRYERRLAFRSHLEPAIGGTIPPEWDDLSDREREYYQTGPWSTREDYSKGQLVQPGPGRQGYSGKKFVTHQGVKYPVITKKGHPHEGKIVYQGSSRKKDTTDYLKDKDALIKRRKKYDTTTDVGRFTAKEAEEFRSKIPKSEVGNIYLIKDRGGIYRIQSGIWGGGEHATAKGFTATEDNIIKAQDFIMDAYKKRFPKALLDSEFANLRLNDENINLSNEEFAKKIKNRTTQQGKKWTYQSVSQTNIRVGIADQVNPTRIKKYSIKQIKNIIRESSGGQKFINANMKNEEVLRREAKRLLDNIRSAKNLAGFPVSDNNSSKLWRNLFESSKKGDRIKVRGTFNGKNLANRANWPKTKDGSIDWRARGTDDVPFYQKIKFQDTQAPNKAVFSWEKGKDIKGGNLKNQIDSVFGNGFFDKSTKAYTEQALDRKTMIKTRGGLKSISEILSEKLIRAEAKAEGIVPTEEYILEKKKKYSLKDVHHNKGIANDPYSTESTLRAANRALGKYETEYAAGRMTNQQFIKKIREIGTEHGGIRREVEGVMVGKKATQESILENIAEKTGLSKKTYKEMLVKLGCGMYAGGRVGFAVGSGKCITRAVAKLRSGDLTVAEKKIVDAMGDGLGKGGMPKKFWTMKNFVKGEGYFALADFANNLTKGQSLDKSFSNAVEMATFGALDLKGTERDLMKYAKERGLDTKDIEEWMEYAKTWGTREKKIGDLELAQDAAAGKDTMFVGPYDEMLVESRIKELPGKIKNLEEEIKEQEKAESIQSGKGYKDMNEAIEGVVAKEWNKPAGTPLDRGLRKMVGIKGDEGLIWGPIGNLFREGFEKIGFGEHDALKGFKPQTVMNYHPAYGYKEDIKDVIREGDSPMEDMLYFMEKYYPRSGLVEEALRAKKLEEKEHWVDTGFGREKRKVKTDMGTYDYNPNLLAGGGIAGLSGGKRFGPPPLSGPVPQGGGLSSQFNRVKKLTE